MTAVIHRLNVSEGGVPKRPIEVGHVTKAGLVGDRQAKSIHGGLARALSLFPFEHIESLAANDHPLQPGTLGENVTTRGLDWSVVVPGARLWLGEEVLIRITSYAAPCLAIAGAFSNGNVNTVNPRVAPGWSRAYAEVLREGWIRPGDAITVEPVRPHGMLAPGEERCLPRSMP